jgi:aryl carrier-like protein
MEYSILNIENEVEIKETYDIIIAANVIHSTKELKVSLNNMNKLLNKDGIIILLEVVNPNSYLDLTFGLTTGWYEFYYINKRWRFSDYEIRKDYPLLSLSSWFELLKELKFENINNLKIKNVSQFDEKTSLSIQEILIFSKNIYQNNQNNENNKENKNEENKNNEKNKIKNENKKEEKKLIDKKIIKEIKNEIIKFKNQENKNENKEIMKTKIENFLIELISNSLLIEKNKIKKDENLITLGLDSLLLIEIRNIIKKELKIIIPIDIFINEILTIKSLSDSILNLFIDDEKILNNIDKDDDFVDVKKENIMLSNFENDEFRPFILSFGLAVPDYKYKQNDLAKYLSKILGFFFF